MGGDQWLKLDAHFLGKPFTLKVAERFGAAGVLTWVAFLAACKQGQRQGAVTFGSEDALYRLLFPGFDVPLTDDSGVPWTLEEFFTYTGRMKQTRKTAHGRVQNVFATHWERWQNDQKTADARERKRRSRAQNGHKNVTLENENEKENEKENESGDVTSPATSQGAVAVTSPLNGNGHRPPPGEPDQDGADRARQIRQALAAQRRTTKVTAPG